VNISLLVPKYHRSTQLLNALVRYLEESLTVVDISAVIQISLPCENALSFGGGKKNRAGSALIRRK
jgi:hypothetical protein